MPYSLNDAQARLNIFKQNKTPARADMTGDDWSQMQGWLGGKGYTGGDLSDDLYRGAERWVTDRYGALPESPTPPDSPVVSIETRYGALPESPTPPDSQIVSIETKSAPTPQGQGEMPSDWTFTGDRGPGNPSDADVWDFLSRNPGDEHRVDEAFGNIPGLPVNNDGSVPSNVGLPSGGGTLPAGGPVGSTSNTVPPPNVPPILDDTVGDLFEPAAPTPLQLQMQAAIEQLLTKSQQPVSITDPNLQPAADAFRSRQQRTSEKLRSQAAERAAQAGTLGTGGFDVEAAGYTADAGLNAATFEANLVLQEMESRRQDLTQAIQLAMATGQFEQTQRLQQQLALLDASMQRQQQLLNASLGGRELDIREALGGRELDIRQLLGGRDLDIREALGGRDLDIRQLLGQGALDLDRELGLGDLGVRQGSLTLQGQLGRGSLAMDLIRALMQNDQYYSGLGLDAAKTQQLFNQIAIQQLFSGF